MVLKRQTSPLPSRLLIIALSIALCIIAATAIVVYADTTIVELSSPTDTTQEDTSQIGANTVTSEGRTKIGVVDLDGETPHIDLDGETP